MRSGKPEISTATTTPKKNVMHSSIRSADPMTHIKIVVVSLLAAVVVVAVGINARSFGVNVDAPVVSKGGKPVNFSTKDIPTVR